MSRTDRYRGWLCIGALLAATAVLAAGCGGGGTSSGGSSGGSTTPATTENSGSGGSTPETQTLDLSTGPVAVQAAVSLGVKKGFFKEEGIDLKISLDTTSADAMPLLLKGERQVVLGGVSTPISAVAQGLPVTLVGAFAGDQTTKLGTTFAVVSAPGSGISSWSGLEGATVGTNTMKCCFEFWVKAAMRENGADPSSVHFISVPFPEGPSALEQKRVQAVVTIQPFVLLSELAGGTLIGDPMQEAFGFDNPTSAAASMSKAFVEENPEVAEHFLAAVKKSSEYANAHPHETLEVIHELTEAPMEVLEKMSLPEYTSTLNTKVVEQEAKWLEEEGVIEKAPSLEEMVWSNADVGH